MVQQSKVLQQHSESHNKSKNINIDYFDTVSPFIPRPILDVKWLESRQENIEKLIDNSRQDIFDINKLNGKLKARGAQSEEDLLRRIVYYHEKEKQFDYELKNRVKNIRYYTKITRMKKIAQNRIKRLTVLKKQVRSTIEKDVYEYAQCLSTLQRIHGGYVNYHSGCQAILNVSPKVSRSVRSVTLDLLQSLKFDIDEMKRRAGRDLPVIPDGLINPPLFQEDSFNYNNIYEVPVDSKYRYIPNFSYSKFCKKYDRRIPTLQECKETSFKRIVRAVHIMMRDYMNEARVMYIDKVIRGLMESYVSVNPEYDIQLPLSIPMYYIHKLLEKYSDWPYLEVMQKMRYNLDEDMPSCLPTVIYALCNLCVEHILGNINDNQICVAIDVWLSWANDCFNQQHLDNKSNYTDPFKLLNERVHNCEIPVYNIEGSITGTKILKNTNEVWYDEENEKEELWNKIAQTHISYQQLFKFKYEEGFNDVHELTRFKVACAIIANPGNYKKTAPILELKKSVAPRTEYPLKNPKFKKKLITEDGDYYWEVDWNVTEQLNGMWNQFKKRKNKVIQNLQLKDFANEYFARITNKSAGKKLDDNVMMQLPPEFRKYVTQRLIQALLELEKFTDENVYLLELKKLGKCGIRMQIDRRLRLIEIVNNLIQALSLIAYLYAEALADTVSDIASGKQVGDIRDMLDTLVGTANENTFVSSMDISGADASTQKSLGLFIFYAALECMEEYKPERYFWATKKVFNAIDLEKDIQVKVTLNPLEHFVMKSLNQIQDVNFILSDGVFGRDTLVSGLTFWSGLFHTAGEHNTVLSHIIAWVVEEYTKKVDVEQIGVTWVESGDDIKVTVKSEDEREVKRFITVLSSHLLQIGMKVSKDLSRFSGVFLQQEAHFGVNRPKPDRLSLVCSEKGESLGRTMHDQFTEVKEMLLEVSPRSYYPENILSILRGMFNVNRMVSYKWGEWYDKDDYIDRINSLRVRFQDFATYVESDETGLYIIAPYVYLFHSEGLSSPHPSIITDYGYLDQASYMMPEGDICEAMIRKCYEIPEHLYPEKIKNELKKKEDEIAEKYLKIHGKPLPFKDPTLAYIPQYKKLDQDKLREDGWTLSQHLAKVWKREVLHDMRVSNDIVKDRVSQLTAKLEEYQNKDRMFRSRAAWEKLVQIPDLKLHDNIAYFMRARVRIEQSLKEAPASDEEIRTVNVNNLEQILRYDGVYRSHVNEGMFNFEIDFSDELFTPHRDYYNNAKVPILIGSHTRTQMGAILRYGHTVLTKTSGTPTHYGRFDASKFQGIRIEDIVYDGVKVYNRNPALLNEFFEMVNIPQNLIEDLRLMITDVSKFGTSSFRTVLRPRLYFLISTNPQAFRHACVPMNVVGVTRKARDFNNYSRVVLRDFILSYAHRFVKLRKIGIRIKTETARLIQYGRKLTMY